MKKILRKPILDPKKVLLKKAKEYLDYYNTLGQATEEDILDVSYYYDFKARQVCNLTGFRSLSITNYASHKNWKFFAKLFNLCYENKWNYKIYIDAQFERASYWQHTKRPYPSQLTAKSCQEYYIKYLKGKEEECRADGTKVKAKKAVNIYAEIEDALIKDCILIRDGIKYLKGEDNLSDKKTTVLFNNLLSLSPYYIFSVDWMVSVLDEYIKTNSNETLLEIREKIDFISRSPKVSEFIYKTLSIIEQKMALPKTLSEEEIINE